jgi:hypothetical protein
MLLYPLCIRFLFFSLILASVAQLDRATAFSCEGYNPHVKWSTTEKMLGSLIEALIAGVTWQY